MLMSQKTTNASQFMGFIQWKRAGKKMPISDTVQRHHYSVLCSVEAPGVGRVVPVIHLYKLLLMEWGRVVVVVVVGHWGNKKDGSSTAKTTRTPRLHWSPVRSLLYHCTFKIPCSPFLFYTKYLWYAINMSEKTTMYSINNVSNLQFSLTSNENKEKKMEV